MVTPRQPLPVILPEITHCPKCNRALFREVDPEYGDCIVHGPQFLGVAPPLAEKPGRNVGSVKL